MCVSIWPPIGRCNGIERGSSKFAVRRLSPYNHKARRAPRARLKRFFKRPRPYHLEPGLKPLARIQHPSFTSGHTLWAFTQAYLFSEIIPEKREQFLNMAEEVRWSRELMGIHYPSDNEASRVIGWYLLKYWSANPQFAADLEKAKIEWHVKKDSFRAKQ
jgi:acid phosphatase (class A)